MANTAEVINFPVPDVALRSCAWQISMMALRASPMNFLRLSCGGFVAASAAGVHGCNAQNIRFNKKSDWVSNDQLS
jgi:hypothetical protein